jgi:hypothetical protein
LSPSLIELGHRQLSGIVLAHASARSIDRADRPLYRCRINNQRGAIPNEVDLREASCIEFIALERQFMVAQKILITRVELP